MAAWNKIVDQAALKFLEIYLPLFLSTGIKGSAQKFIIFLCLTYLTCHISLPLTFETRCLST